RRVERDVVGAVVTVAAGALGVDAADVRGLEAEHLGEVSTEGKHALAVGPDRELRAFPLRDGARWADRAVARERARVERLECLRRRRRARRGLVHDGLARHRRAHELLVQGLAARWQRHGLAPARTLRERLTGANGLLFALGGDGQEASVADDGDDTRQLA